MTVHVTFHGALLLAALFAQNVARAEPQHLVESARLRLSDLIQTSDPELAEIDLGPAPPPGSSRLFARAEIRRILESFGTDAQRVSLPASIRILSAGRRFSPSELQSLVEPRVRAALPSGVTLKSLRAARPVLASPRIQVGEVRLPRLVRRPGEATLTASVDLLHDGVVTLRLPVTLSVEQSAEAAAPLVRKGARVDLVIARGPARISASAVALQDAELGETCSFRVSSTSKILRARVESPTLALVVTP